MSEPIIAQKTPYVVAVEAGKTYAWCACGRSKNQPFCDGSHAGTGIAPFIWQAKESGMKAFCGCKKTANPPLCDGTHASL